MAPKTEPFKNQGLPGQGTQSSETNPWKKASIVLGLILLITIGYVLIDAQSKNEIPEKIVRYHLARFVKNIRSISSDPVVVRNCLEEAYSYITLKGRKQLDKILKELNLSYRISHRITVSIDINSIVKRHDTLYMVCWVQTEYKNSQEISKVGYEGFFRIKFLPTKPSKDYFLINPFGIYINNIVINKSLKQKRDS